MYWEHPGEGNTARTVELALKAAREKGIARIVVASCSGRTAALLAGKGPQVVCVTHVNGFADAGSNEMPDAMRQSLQAQGVMLLTATHVLSGAERGLSRRFGGVYPVEIMAHALRMFGQGVKVCVEVSVMALDAGLIPYQQDVIAIGGTGRGVDTAVIIRPAHAAEILDTFISEIICKPRSPH